jgi:hypothetical protein
LASETGSDSGFNFLPGTTRIKIIRVGGQASVKQRFFFGCQRVIVVDPIIRIEFRQLQPNRGAGFL